jgi:hypothetical protein
LSSPTRDFTDPYLLDARLQKHRIARGHDLRRGRYYIVTAAVRSLSISIAAEDQNRRIVDIDAIKPSTGERSAAPSVKQSGDREVIFMGEKSLGFGLQLYELIYDNFRNQLKFARLQDIWH